MIGDHLASTAQPTCDFLHRVLQRHSIEVVRRQDHDAGGRPQAAGRNAVCQAVRLEAVFPVRPADIHLHMCGGTVELVAEGVYCVPAKTHLQAIRFGPVLPAYPSQQQDRQDNPTVHLHAESVHSAHMIWQEVKLVRHCALAGFLLKPSQLSKQP